MHETAGVANTHAQLTHSSCDTAALIRGFHGHPNQTEKRACKASFNLASDALSTIRTSVRASHEHQDMTQHINLQHAKMQDMSAARFFTPDAAPNPRGGSLEQQIYVQASSLRSPSKSLISLFST